MAFSFDVHTYIAFWQYLRVDAISGCPGPRSGMCFNSLHCLHEFGDVRDLLRVVFVPLVGYAHGEFWSAWEHYDVRFLSVPGTPADGRVTRGGA
jgi:hypothetical protein